MRSKNSLSPFNLGRSIALPEITVRARERPLEVRRDGPAIVTRVNGEEHAQLQRNTC